jgi:hypothetical protein
MKLASRSFGAAALVLSSLALAACEDGRGTPMQQEVSREAVLNASADPENQGGGLSRDGVQVLRFRSEEDPSVTPDPAVCAAAGFTANVRFGAVLYSEASNGHEGRIVNRSTRRIGTATACARITDPTFPADLRQEFYVRFDLPEGPVTARGGCTLVTNNVPTAGLVLAGCHLRVTEAPSWYVGGAVSSLSVFNPRRLEGFLTGSDYTIQLYEKPRA